MPLIYHFIRTEFSKEVYLYQGVEQEMVSLLMILKLSPLSLERGKRKDVEIQLKSNIQWSTYLCVPPVLTCIDTDERMYV